jgi:hypothetical protein
MRFRPLPARAGRVEKLSIRGEVWVILMKDLRAWGSGLTNASDFALAFRQQAQTANMALEEDSDVVE